MLFVKETIERHDGISVMNAAIALLGLSARVVTNLHSTGVVATFTISSYAIWSMITRFMALLENGNFPHINGQRFLAEVTEQYRKLVVTVDAINAIWSKLCLWLVIHICVYMSTWLDMLVMAKENKSRVIVEMVEVIIFVAGVIFSAESFRKVSPQYLYLQKFKQILGWN